MNFRRSFVVVAGVIMTLVLGATPALATVTGDFVCNQETGDFDVTWTYTTFSDADETVTKTTRPEAIPVGTEIPGGTTQTFTETLPGTSTEELKLRIDVVTDTGREHVSNTVTLQLTGDCEQPPPTTVTPVAPGVDTSKKCEVKSTYTIRAVEGVEYLVDGSVVPPGTYSGTGTVTVTARALPGFELAGQSEWVLELGTPEKCEDEQPPPKDECPGLPHDLERPCVHPTDVVSASGNSPQVSASGNSAVLPFTGMEADDYAGIALGLIAAGLFLARVRFENQPTSRE